MTSVAPELWSPEAIFEPVKELQNELDIPADQMVIVGGAVLQIHGLKITEDIDVVVSDQILDRVLTLPEKDRLRRIKMGRIAGVKQLVLQGQGQELKELEYPEYQSAVRGKVSLMEAPHDDLYRATFEELQHEAESMQGVLVSPLARILFWKQAVNRAKDQKDIALITKALSQ